VISALSHSLAESAAVCRVARPSSIKLVNWTIAYRWSVSTDAQWVVRVDPLVETGCTSRRVTGETIEETPLMSAEVKTKDESCWIISEVGVYRRVNLSGFCPLFLH